MQATIGHGTLKGIAWRARDGDAMVEADSETLVAAAGLTAESGRSSRRGVTFLSWESWHDVCREMNRELPWHGRRANLLIEGVDLGKTLGRELMIGSTRILIHGETKPCALMDATCAGLRAVLGKEMRGGVFGEVITGGPIRVGDRVTVRTAEPSNS